MDELWQVGQYSRLHERDVVISQVERFETGQSVDEVRRQGPQVVVA